MPAEALAMFLSGVMAVGSAATGATRPAEPPDTELLEFLGSYETAAGKWVDPTTLNSETSTPAAPAVTPTTPAPPHKEKSP